MNQNDLKMALRSLLRNRFHFSLNLIGLTFSLSVLLFIALYLHRELTFDNFHEDGDRIYRIVEQQSSPAGGDQRIATVSFNASTGAREEVAGVADAVKILQLGRFLLTNENNRNSSYQPYIAVEESFFNVLTFPLQAGNKQSLYEPLRPMVIGFRSNPIHSIDYFTAKLEPGTAETTIAQMTDILHQVDPNQVFEYHFLDDQLQLFYEADRRRSQLFSAATGFAIFIACLGLFGLAAFMAEQRTKEIGIRKVLGASVSQVAALLSKDFLLLVGLAVLIGLPIAWWAVQRWLENFSFNVGLHWWMFAIPVVLAMLIAFLTVSFHAVKAAVRNPVESLRYE